MAFFTAISAGFIFIWELLKSWSYIFISPLEKPEIFWIVIPIWASWIFAEFFQEKKGTSFGNAISNGVIPLFISIDWARYLTVQLSSHAVRFDYLVKIKYGICIFVMLYGLSVILFGIKGKKFVHFYGRIREVTYVLLMFSPVVYGIIKLSWAFLISFALFFPLYYFIIELIDKYTPDPKIYDYDEKKDSSNEYERISGKSSEFGSSNLDLNNPESDFQNPRI